MVEGQYSLVDTVGYLTTQRLRKDLVLVLHKGRMFGSVKAVSNGESHGTFKIFQERGI